MTSTENPFAGRRHLFFLNWLRTGAGMINRELAFAREIAKRGGIVRILSHFEPQIHLPDIPVDVLVQKPFRHRWYDHWLTRTLIDRRASEVLHNFRPHVVFTDLPVEADRVLRLRDAHTKLVHTYHGTADGTPFDPETARELDLSRAHSHDMLREADLPLVVSDYLLREVETAGVTNAHRLYNGVDLDHWRPATEAPKHPPRILFIGRYTESKGVHLLIDAFLRAAPQIPDAHLQLHGFFERPAYETQLRATIESSDLAHRIHMRGPLDWNEMPAAIHRCTVFANGSVDESFCMPFLEAQACGRACLGFDSRGIPEVVLHQKTGLLAPPHDIATLAEHLVTLITDDILRETLADNALRHARTFDYPLLTNELARLMPALNIRPSSSSFRKPIFTPHPNPPPGTMQRTSPLRRNHPRPRKKSTLKPHSARRPLTQKKT